MSLLERDFKGALYSEILSVDVPYNIILIRSDAADDYLNKKIAMQFG